MPLVLWMGVLRFSMVPLGLDSWRTPAVDEWTRRPRIICEDVSAAPRRRTFAPLHASPNLLHFVASPWTPFSSIIPHHFAGPRRRSRPCGQISRPRAFNLLAGLACLQLNPTRGTARLRHSRHPCRDIPRRTQVRPNNPRRLTPRQRRGSMRRIREVRRRSTASRPSTSTELASRLFHSMARLRSRPPRHRRYRRHRRSCRARCRSLICRRTGHRPLLNTLLAASPSRPHRMVNRRPPCSTHLINLTAHQRPPKDQIIRTALRECSPRAACMLLRPRMVSPSRRTDTSHRTKETP